MAFTYTKLDQGSMGNKVFAYGTFASSGGDTGGDIYTGLDRVNCMFFSGSGAAVVADFPAINETFTQAGLADGITIVTTANAEGYWFAFGS